MGRASSSSSLPVKKDDMNRSVSWRHFEAITELFRITYQLLEQVIIAARLGQNLPRLTLFFLAHLAFHLFILSSMLSMGSSCSRRLELHVLILHRASLALLLFSALLLGCGYILLIALYRHSVQTIFNCSLPSRHDFVPSFGAHLALLKPLEIIFRWATVRFRVLPDILVLGEVRCGTTTLCQHLSSTVSGCEPPFCLWRHPELDDKETFYFVGHYLGRVHPHCYRMCFPLATVKWFRQAILRKPFFTYDGCAQYLTNPAVPHLIAKAYYDAGQPPPVLVACVRDPVDQAVSWWTYENNAMLWGRSMGLNQWNTELRSPQYPPQSISGALDFSMSETVDEAYRMTEDLFCGNQERAFILPPWAMTWPAGQLSGIGRSGRYAANIQRYERVFSKVFSSAREKVGGGDQRTPSKNDPSNLQFVNVVPLEFLGNEQKLNVTLTLLVEQMDARRDGTGPLLKDEMSDLQASVHIKRNASLPSTCASYLKPTQADVERLQAYFSEDFLMLNWDDSGRCSILKRS